MSSVSSRAAGPLLAVGENETSLCLQMCLEHSKFLKARDGKEETCSQGAGHSAVGRGHFGRGKDVNS